MSEAAAEAAPSARAAIPLLCFRARALRLAIAAEDVTAIEEGRAEARHIAELLDAAAAPPELSRRLICARTPGDAPGEVVNAAFLVDPPVALSLCRREQILPLPQRRLVAGSGAVMGFAQLDAGMHMLLDLAIIIRTLRGGRRKGAP